MDSFLNKTQAIAIVFVWLVGLLLGCTPSRPANRRDPTAITPAQVRCTANLGPQTGKEYACMSTVNRVPMCGTCDEPTENFGCNGDWRPMYACCFESDCK